MDFKPSKYQQDIFDFIKYGYGNAVIEAMAGAGKSTSIIKCLDFIKADKKVLFLAFNNSIVDELSTKIKRDKTDIKTLHSLGHSILKYNFKDKYNLLIDDLKYKKRMNRMLDSEPHYDLSDKEYKKYKNNILKLIDLGRFHLSKNIDSLNEIANKHNIVLIKDELEQVFELLKWGRNESIEQTSSIDFGDMLYLPNVLPVRTFKYDFIIVDEAQDLSNAQLQLFLKCFKQGGRFICVGDKNQCIYSFSGADFESFNKIKALPNTTLLPLSICYRCPTKVITMAQKFVPEIEARENAPEGYIKYNANIEDVKDGDMVICRNTLPLVKLYLQLIVDGKKAYVKGKDIGLNLIDIINNVDEDVEELNYNLENKGVFTELYSMLITYIEQLKKTYNIQEEDVYETQEFNNMLDSIECLEVASYGLEFKSQLLTRLKNIFEDKSTEGICLSTIHKAKGLESDNVFILNKNLLPSKFVKQDWEKEQERNLEYVAITRPKKMLGFIYDKDNMVTSEKNNIADKISDIRNLINKL